MIKTMINTASIMINKEWIIIVFNIPPKINPEDVVIIEYQHNYPGYVGIYRSKTKRSLYNTGCSEYVIYDIVHSIYIKDESIWKSIYKFKNKSIDAEDDTPMSDEAFNEIKYEVDIRIKAFLLLYKCGCFETDCEEHTINPDE